MDKSTVSTQSGVSIGVAMNCAFLAQTNRQSSFYRDPFLRDDRSAHEVVRHGDRDFGDNLVRLNRILEGDHLGHGFV